MPRTDLGCPDCNGKYDLQQTLRHETGCPVGDAYDRVSEMDRRWFEEHPGESFYTREMTDDERLTLLATVEERPPDPPPGRHWKLCGEVGVAEIGPGVRARNFRTWWVLLP